MTEHVSFCELSMETGKLIGRLGSGTADEVLDRSQTDPYIRICVQEPSDKPIQYRATCGRAELTPEGPLPVPPQDPTERRGAWIRIISIGARVEKVLRDAWRNCEADPANIPGLNTGWGQLEGQILKEMDPASVRRILSTPHLSASEDRIFVRLGGTSNQLFEALSLLDETMPSDASDED